MRRGIETDEGSRYKGLTWHRWRRQEGLVILMYGTRWIKVRGRPSNKRCPSTMIHLQGQIRTRRATAPMVPAMSSTTAPSPMKVAHVLPCGNGPSHLATGQRRGSLSTIFSRDLTAGPDHVASLGGTLASRILPLPRSRESP